MATFTWNAGSADWSTATDWTPSGGPPGLTAGVDTAVLSSLSSSYTVSIASSDPTYDLAQLDIGSTTAGKTVGVTIAGTLETGTLDYTTTATGFGSTSISISAGGVFDVTSSISDAGGIDETISISGKGTHGLPGGTLELGSLSVGNSADLGFSFSNNSGAAINNGVIDFQSAGASTTSEHIVAFDYGDSIVVAGDTFTSATLSGGVLTVKDGATTVLTMNNVTSSATSFNILNGDTISAVCYARGTMIRTTDGEIPVERLRPGKSVMTLVDGKEVPQAVKWLGHRRIDLTTHPRPDTVAPIRILRGAFADATPHRDLLVSPDHAIFSDGKLICARQLVNGTTIRQETDWTAVDYYHVELDSHAILLAEGLPAESYIDTGNSGFFANSGSPLMLYPDLTDESDYPTREAGSCAPFVWDEASVQPVWQRLADRAAALGKPVRQGETTTEADLHLVAKGRKVKPVYHDSDLVIFALPRAVSEVHLVSLAQSPTAARPWLDDRRKLGVRISRILLRSVDDMREIPVDHPGLASGWWAVEQDGVAQGRWTSGDAVLALPAMDGNAMLEIHLAGTMTYVVEAETDAQRRAA